MGQIVDKIQNCSDNVADILSGRRKRKRSIDAQSNSDDEQRNENDTPKKKRLLTTTQYIYKALFKEQKNSDVAVMALDKIWNLHKVYLSQSPYFYTMFNGSWRESQQNYVNIKILDERITVDALDAVFGSMYSDEIEIDVKYVVSILATATLFHLEGIIEKCAEVMIDNINVETAVEYYEAACQYGVMNVKKSAFNWFLINLLSICNKHPKMLRQISIDLMKLLTANSDLYVMQTEFSLYTVLRTWMFLRLNPDYDPEDPKYRLEAMETHQRMMDIGVETNIPAADIMQWTYFAGRTEERSFLATPEGRPYVGVFQRLRTQYLTNHYMDLKIIFNDNIIPKEWLYRHIHSHWDALLRIDHGQDDGPKQLDLEDFSTHSMRCGRMLLEPGYQKWRWTGFNLGLDLIFIMDSRRLSIRRHHRHEHERVLTLRTRRKFLMRTTVTSINEQRQPIFTQTSEVKTFNLEKNEEVQIMMLDTKLVHPLLISVNLLVVSPANQSYKALVPDSEDILNVIPISEIGTSLSQSASADDSAVFVGNDDGATTNNSTTNITTPTTTTATINNAEATTSQLSKF